MGYWGPPPPSSYDPSPRPLRHYARVVEGETLEYPEPEDEEYYGIGVSRVAGASPIPALQPLVGGIGPGPRRSNKVQTFRGSWWGTQSPYERLIAYQRLIAIRAPEDPLSGGLAPDWVEPDGTLHIQYFDFSDEKEPRRKETTLKPKPSGGVDIHVFEWYPNEQRWGDEGFDAERGFGEALVPIMQGIQIVSTAIVSIFATPAVGAAWAAAMQVGVDQAAGKAPPSIEAAFGMLGSFASAANIGTVLASEEGKNFVAGMYKSIGTVVPGDFLSKLTKVAGDAVGSLPKVDLSGALEGAIPDELIALDLSIGGDYGPNTPGSHSDVFSKASSAFAAFAQGQSRDVFYSIRKTVDETALGGKGAFDLTFAALYGEANAPPDPRFLVDQASDPSATLTWRAALARGKQAMSAPGDPGTMSFRQVLGISGGEVRIAQEKKTAVKTGVGVAAVIAALAIAKRFLF